MDWKKKKGKEEIFSLGEFVDQGKIRIPFFRLFTFGSREKLLFEALALRQLEKNLSTDCDISESNSAD